jgi:hypothetical protein
MDVYAEQPMRIWCMSVCAERCRGQIMYMQARAKKREDESGKER